MIKAFKYYRLFMMIGIAFALSFISCQPWVEDFEEGDDSIDTIYYSAKKKSNQSDTPETITAMAWNIRFGAGRTPWFGDSCGDRVILTEKEVLNHLQGIADKINKTQPDVLIINEIDIESKRSAYIDQVQWLLDNTYFNYGVYAPVWKIQFIPSDGLGRMDMGNAVLSRWPMEDAIRIPLPLRGDQDALTQYFYLRRNILEVKIDVPNVSDFYVVNIHASAFAKDDTKKQHLEIFKDELDHLHAMGAQFVAGGDLNTLPPGAVKTNYCADHICPDEDPADQEGCDFSKETTWLQDLYDTFQPAVPLAEYLANEANYATHTPDPEGFWQYKLDYLFTNGSWVTDTYTTHQDAVDWSDHTPVSARWEVPK